MMVDLTVLETFHLPLVLVVFFFNLDLLLFNTAINVSYIAHHFILHSLDTIIVCYGSYNDL